MLQPPSWRYLEAGTDCEMVEEGVSLVEMKGLIESHLAIA